MKKTKKEDKKEVKSEIHPDFWFLVIGILVLGAVVGYAIGSYSGGAATGKAYAGGDTYCYETDGGDRPLLKGSAWGKLNGTKYNNTDRCNSPARQREYYCVGSLKKDKYYNCNCVDGACVQNQTNTTCTDTDGTNPFITGTVTYGDQTYTDYCTYWMRYKEYSCYNGVMEQNEVPCTNDNIPVGHNFIAGLSATNYFVLGFAGINPSLHKIMITDIASHNNTEWVYTLIDDYIATGSMIYGGFTYNYLLYIRNASSSLYIINGMDFLNCTTGSCTIAMKQTTCSDSDPYQNVFFQGRVNGTLYNGFNFDQLDYCSGEKVAEVYCDPMMPWQGYNVNITSCPVNYRCSNGVCVDNQTNTTCTDSDGGYNIYTKGTAYNGTVNASDRCSGTLLVENYCSGTKVMANITGCPANYNCSDGACINLTCTDSDGGQNKYVKGVTSNAESAFEDYCYGTDIVYEGFCYGPQIRATQMACGDGYYCTDGACLETTNETTPCFDSDGWNVLTAGYVLNEGHFYNDSCNYYYNQSMNTSREEACANGIRTGITADFCKSRGISRWDYFVVGHDTGEYGSILLRMVGVTNATGNSYITVQAVKDSTTQLWTWSQETYTGAMTYYGTDYSFTVIPTGPYPAYWDIDITSGYQFNGCSDNHCTWS